ncbi:MAG: STN domain-containing protein [Planctomycetaceae bacterium]|nr:STN domain-containing protein [Planctomycetaceae bacterium]
MRDLFSTSRHGRGRRWTLGLILAACVLIFVDQSQADDGSSAPRLAGSELRKELESPINVTIPQTRVREVVLRLESLHNVAILLDRRIDPDRLIDVQLTQVTLLEGIEFLANQLEADAALVGGTVVIGPTDKLDRTRTDIVIQHQTLKDSSSEQGQRRLFELFSGKSFRWDNLQTPRELVQSIGEGYGVEVTGLDLIPHDLWAAGEMIDVSAVEALMLAAGQFDLTCQWNEDASIVQLAPAPSRLTIEKELTVNPAILADVFSELSEEVPLADISVEGRRVRVIGSVAEQELIESRLKRNSNGDREPMPDQGPLAKRSFTLKTERTPAIAILRTLEAQGTSVEYDLNVLTAAGVDLSQKVTLSLQKASADEFFQALCEPLRLQFEIEDRTVILTPKP